MATRTISRSRRGVSRSQGLLGILLLSVAIIVAASILKPSSGATAASVSQPIVAEFDSVALPVPSEYVPAGKKVREIRFRTVSFPKHQVPTGALVSLDSVLESVTVAPLPANLPLFAENFAHSGAGSNPVIESIPSGMRAMTIRVDATSSVEGWAGSGTTVDILLVENDRTSVVAEKVRILSAERSVSPVEGQTPNVPSTVTVLVTQEQCLAINTAIPRGKIAFALRSTKDEDSWDDTVYTTERLRGASTSPDKRAIVNGYIAIKGLKTESFALTDGKWTRTEVLPQGFLSARQNDSTPPTTTK